MAHVITLREDTYHALVGICGDFMVEFHYPISLSETVQHLIDLKKGIARPPRRRGQQPETQK